MRPRVLIINGSLGGAVGNTGRILPELARALADRAETETLVLSDAPAAERVQAALARAQALVFATGTYWDSWGSLLQRFLEDATASEATDVWLGKPVAVLVTTHSVGGKGVLSGLQGVLNTLGCAIPPMSGMVYAMANHLALRGPPSEFHADLWQPGDLRVIAHNLLEAVGGGRDWRVWPVDTGDARRAWYAP